MKSLCVITIKLNTLTDVPYEMTVGGAFVGAFVYVRERDRVKDFVYYNAVRYNTFFPVDPDDPVIMELQCILLLFVVLCWKFHISSLGNFYHITGNKSIINKPNAASPYLSKVL